MTTPSNIARAFVCVDCGRHMISLGAEPPDPTRCLACQHMPGWHLDLRLREVMRLRADPSSAASTRDERKALH